MPFSIPTDVSFLDLSWLEMAAPMVRPYVRGILIFWMLVFNMEQLMKLFNVPGLNNGGSYR